MLLLGRDLFLNGEGEIWLVVCSCKSRGAGQSGSRRLRSPGANFDVL